MDRDERRLLFRRLAEASAAHPDARGEPAGDAAPAAAQARGGLDRFASTLTEAGGLFLPGPAESALNDLAEALRAEGVTALFFPDDDAPARRVAEALVPLGPFAVTSGASVRGGEAAVTAGVRTADAAIAETGTVVESSAGGKSLLPGLLSDVHVSLLPEGALVDRMDEALALFYADPPRNISFCSGPSKSADIEQTLTVGAHGPRKLIVVPL